MSPPDVFHLHYHVPDVEAAATTLARHGVEPVARFGTAAGESVSLSPEERPPDGFRLRLQTNRGGRADVTLAPAPRLAFDHLGVVVADVEAVVDRAEERGWSATANPRRTFLVTPWGFRIEIQEEGSDLLSELGSGAACRFVDVTLSAPVGVRDDVDRGIRAVVGDVTNLRVRPTRRATAAVTTAELAGSAVDDRRFEMASLAPDTDADR